MYDATEITKKLVFGTASPSSDYLRHIRPTDANAATQSYPMLDYMTDGGGRFAYPSLYGVVDKFFTSPNIPNGNHSLAQLSTYIALSLTDYKLEPSQYGTGIGSHGHSVRSYIFGNTKFLINNLETADFCVSDDGRSVSNFDVVAEVDNFDFGSVDVSASQPEI